MRPQKCHLGAVASVLLWLIKCTVCSDSQHFVFNWSPPFFSLDAFIKPVQVPTLLYVLVLLTMNSRLQTQDWASVPCVRTAEMTENIEALWDFGVLRPEFLRVWGLCRADIPHTEQSLACFQAHIVLGSTLAVKTHAAVQGSLHTLPSGPRSPAAVSRKR